MSSTPNLGLGKPPDGQEPWGDLYRAAMDTLDSVICKEHNADGTHLGKLTVTESMLSAALAAKINAITNAIPLTGTVPGSEVSGDVVFDSCGIVPRTASTGYVGTSTKHWAHGYFDTLTVSSWPNGTFEASISGPAVVEGSAVRFGSDGKLYLAKADSISTLPCIGMVSSVTAGVATVRAWGYSKFTSGSVSFAPYNLLYVSESNAGELTHIPPSYGMSYYHQVVGFSIGTTEVLIMMNLQPVRV